MIEIAFWVSVGAFIGWNLPQPEFARKVQEKFLDYVDNLYSK